MDDWHGRHSNKDGKGKSPFIYKIGLTKSEGRDLLEFLRTLDEPGVQPQKP